MTLVADTLPLAVPQDQPPLAKRAVDAFAWRLLSESAKLVLQVGVQVMLARMLPLEAFGLLAVMMMVVNFGSRLSEVGTAPAIVQRQELSSLHIRAAFSLSVLCGTLVTVAIWAGAPLAATLFKVREVTPVLRAIGFVFVFSSFGTTAEALMQRQLDYRRLLRVELASYAFGFAGIAIPLALLDYGVWALVWATLGQSVVRTAMLMAMAPHSLKPCFARTETRELLNFGVGLTLARLASFAAQNGDYFVVGRYLGAAALGLYSRAYQVMCLPIYQFSSILNVVLFPACAAIQDDKARLRRVYLGSVCLSGIVVFPTLAMVAIVAPELMTGVFGAQWAPAAAPLQVLCVAGCLYAIYTLADSLARASGTVYGKFAADAVYALSVLGGGSLGSRWHIVGVAAGVTAATLIVYVLMARLSLRLTGSTWRMFFVAQGSGTAVSAAVVAIGAPAAMLLRTTGLGALSVLVIASAVCAVVAIGTTLALPRRWTSANVRDAVGTVVHDAGDHLARLQRRYGVQTI